MKNLKSARIILLFIICVTLAIDKSYSQRDGSNCGKAVILPAPAELCKKEIFKMERKEKWFEFTANASEMRIELDKLVTDPIIEIHKISLYEHKCPTPPLLKESISTGNGELPSLEVTNLVRGKKYLLKLENDREIIGNFRMCLSRLSYTICQNAIFVCNSINNNCFYKNNADGQCYTGDNNYCTPSSCNIFTICTGQNVTFSLNRNSFSKYSNSYYCASYEFSGGIPVTCIDPVVSKTISFGTPGAYTLVVRIINKNTGGEVERTGALQFTVNPSPVADASENITLYPGQRAYLGSLPVAHNNYSWEPVSGLFTPSRAYTIVESQTTTDYILTVRNNYGCTNSDTVKVTVKEPYPGTSDTATTCGYDPREVVDINSKDNRLAIPDVIRSFLENSSATRESQDCGNRFRLHFDDDLLWPGSGFDDATNGASRKQCACDVFQYIETVLEIPAGDNSKIDIAFGASNDTSMNAQVLGKSAPLYNTSFKNNVPGIYSCLAFEHITSGNDPDTAQPNGVVWINFALSNVGPTCDKVTCRYDLFSTILHEATHALGWASLIIEKDTTLPITDYRPVSVTPVNQFTLYDKVFLSYANDISGPFYPIIDPSSPNNNPLINTFFSDPLSKYLRTDKIYLYGTSSKTNQPIYSRDPGVGEKFPFGTSLSHFDARYMLGRNHDAPGFVPNYVMTGEVASWQLKREYTMQELRALQTLGYTIKSTLPQFADLGNHPPFVDGPVITQNPTGYNAYGETLIGINPVLVLDSINNCETDTIDLSTLSALHSGDAGDPIRIFPGSLFNIRGCGDGGNNHNALDVTDGGGTNGSDLISYNPRDNFIGLAQFGFHLYDGKEKGAFVPLSIYVKKGDCFENTPKNEMVINGSFEEGSEVTTLADTTILHNLDWGTLFIGGVGLAWFSTNWNWHHADGMYLNESTTDLLIHNSWVNYKFGKPGWSFPTLSLPNSTDNSNRYIGFQSGFATSEPTYIALAEDVEECKRYILNFDVTNVFLNAITNIKFQFVDKFGDGATTATSVSVTDSGGIWGHIEKKFVYKHNEPPRSLMKIKPLLLSGSNSYVLLDNLSLTLDTTYKPVEAHAGPDTIVCVALK